jgi:hypothetical protein
LFFGFVSILKNTGAAQGGQILDFRVPSVRSRCAAELAGKSQAAKAEAKLWAQARGIPVRYDDGRNAFELVHMRDGRPVYNMTYNVNAAISIGTNLVRNTAPYNLNGNGMIVGIWDGGSVLSTHQEFGTRVSVMDGAASHYHSTHVGGTIGAAGVTANALGMAPGAYIYSYDWNSDTAEMAGRGASYAGEADKIYVSNHSYGHSSGWVYTNSSGNSAYHWNTGSSWSGAGSIENNFGQYDSTARDYDQVAYNAPYYLIFKSAGNDRSDNPSSGETVYYSTNGGFSWNSISYGITTCPPGDGVVKSGYDTISTTGVAKNIVTVGAVNDAVSGGVRSLSNAAMADFSSWGPADDGRIKPDIVANGISLYSCYNSNNSSYAALSGTSMACPDASGSAILLAEYYSELFSGQAMRSSTLKGLILHTADDLGNTGPDYSYGWGLMNTQAAAAIIKAQYDYPSQTKMLEGLLDTSNPSKSYFFEWNGSSPIRITLCWTDPPATAITGHDINTSRLVNDLDLRILGPGGSPVYYPYILDRSSPSAPAATGDNILDNVEQINISSAGTPGIYNLQVTHKGILTNGQQYYSLISSMSISPATYPPVAMEVNAVAPLNTAIYIPLSAADDGFPDPPGALSYMITSLPSGGSLSDPGAGGITAVPYTLVGYGNQVVYTPAPGYAGIDSFMFKANDGGIAPNGGDSNQAAVSIDIGQITVAHSVSAGNDDGYASSSTSQNLTNAYLRIGHRNGYSTPYYMSGMRFVNISVPALSQVVSAQLKICSYNSSLNGMVYGVIQGEDTDNAADFSSRYISGAAKTTASVDWDHLTAWSADTWYNSPDISPVIQEIIDRAGWSAGNALVILYSKRTDLGGNRNFSSCERGAAFAPKLEITYIGPVTLTTSSTAGGLVTTPGQGVFNCKRGTVINIAATPTAGYHFVNWTGTGVTAGKVTNPNSASTAITMDTHYTVAANFAFNACTISGIVTFGGSGLDNVTLNGLPGNPITSGGGLYSAAVDYGWSGTAVPARAGYTFIPGSIIYSNVTSNQANQDYSSILSACTVSGHVLEPDGETPVAGVRMEAGNGGGSGITDANGLYGVSVPYNWSGSVTPAKEGYTFEPNSISYPNVLANSVGDYTATLSTCILSGHILESDFGTPVSDVNVVAENDGGSYTSRYGGGRDTTDPNGRYEVKVDYNWSGVVTPSKYAYGFDPNSRLYVNTVSDQNDQDFAGRLLTFAISGFVRNPCDSPAANVVVSADNGGGNDITDPNGYYEVWVDYNWSGTVRPAREDYVFVPAETFYTDVLSDIPNQAYMADSIYNLDGDCVIGYGDLMRIAESWLVMPAGLDNGDFNADTEVNLLDFAMFARHWLEGV